MNTDALKHLQQPPFNASVQYFLEKGTINGSFHEALKKFLKDNTGAAEQSEEVELLNNRLEGAKVLYEMEFDKVERFKKENEEMRREIKQLKDDAKPDPWDDLGKHSNTGY